MMNKKKLTGLLSVLCVFLGVLVLLCACDTGKTPAETNPPEATTTTPDAPTDPVTDAATEAEATETVEAAE